MAIGLAIVSTEADSQPVDDNFADIPEQMRVRMDKRQKILDQGLDAYPLNVAKTHEITDILCQFDAEAMGPDIATGQMASIAARVIFIRDTGKLAFVRLREGNGSEIQAMLSAAEIGADSLQAFKDFVDLGDHISVTGEIITSKRGELSVKASQWQLAAKTLRPLPVEHKPLSDEARAKMRYVDLIVRPKARELVRMKATVLKSLRATLDSDSYIEVDTPTLQSTNGGAAARPFHTHVNAFDADMLLRIAIELHLKRALVGGVDRVYEIGKTFRNEGVDNTHNPEFMMLEAYCAYGDYNSMAELTESLVKNAAQASGTTVIEGRDGNQIDLMKPWRHANLAELVSEVVQTAVDHNTDEKQLREIAAKHEVGLQENWGSGDILLELFEKLVEHTLLQPTFVRDYPEAVRPLAKKHREKDGLVEAWDLIINGVELAAAYSELNDPVIQRERLEAQSLLAAAGDPEAMDVDEDFLRALEFGMPPAGGLGLGVDRLVMLLGNVGIRESILFPLSRPD